MTIVREVLIDTERLLLRPLLMSDLDDFVGLHEDPEVVRFVRTLDREQAAWRLQANEREWAERGHGMLAVIARAGEQLLGRVGLRHWPQFGEIRQAERKRSSAPTHRKPAAACETSRKSSLPWPYRLIVAPKCG